MSNYTQTTFFTPKDSLPTNNPAKTIFGAAYDVEFAAISTAIASKANLVTPAFTGPITIASGGGLTLGSPTGGDQGVGAINATGLFINGVSLLPQIKTKAASTNRNNTIVLTNDPDMVATLTAGTYLIVGFGSFTTNTVAMGINFGLNYSGTFTAAASNVSFLFPLGNNAGNNSITATVNLAIVSNSSATTGALIDNFYFTAMLVATGSGTLGFAWAQGATNATNLTIEAGSTLIVTKIA